MKITKKETINNYIKKKIADGELKPGDCIPTESELTKIFGFGRQTVHSALKELSIEGIIERTAGKGSFVSGKGVQRIMNKRRSFTEEMRALGLKPGTKILEYRIIKAKENKEVMEALKLKKNDYVHYIVRLRTANDVLREVQYSYTPVKVLKEIDIAKLNGSFDEYMIEKDLIAPNSITKIKIVKDREEDKMLLNVNCNCLLRSTSIRYTGDNKPVQLTYSMINCEQFEYTFYSFD